jgi:hypothetical protein
MGVIPRERARIDMGYSITERDEMRTWDEEADPMQVLAGMVGSKPAAGIPAEQPKAPAADDQ